MTSWRLLAAVVSACSVLSAPAHAGILFVFQEPVRNVEGESFSSTTPSNINVQTTGHLLGGTNGADAFITPFGLGVLSGPADLGAVTGLPHVDGLNPEFLRLEFSEPVQMQRAFFHFAGPGSTDTFDLVIDGVDIDVPSVFGTNRIKNLAPAGQAAGWVEFPDTLPVGKKFDFVAANWSTGTMTFDEWNLEKAEVIPELTPFLLLSMLCVPLTAIFCLRRRLRPSTSAVG